MCAGCCRYITDSVISKTPIIGKWLVKWNNAEIGGPIFKIVNFFCRKRIERCEKDFIEMANEDVG